VDNLPSWLTSYTGSFVGRLNGTTVTGTTTFHSVSNTAGCIANEDYNGPATYILSPDGAAKVTAGPIQRRSTLSGECSGASFGSNEPNVATMQWRKLE
jgi:hypothetical protein